MEWRSDWPDMMTVMFFFLCGRNIALNCLFGKDEVSWRDYVGGRGLLHQKEHEYFAGTERTGEFKMKESRTEHLSKSFDRPPS